MRVALARHSWTCPLLRCLVLHRAPRMIAIPGVGVFVVDSRPGPAQVVKDTLMAKFYENSKGHITTRMHLLDDPRIRFQLLTCCVATRPGFWLRTHVRAMAPSISPTRDDAS